MLLVSPVLTEALARAGLPQVSFQTTGVGEMDPRLHCGPEAADDCHRHNRRFTLRLVGARDLDFDFACVGGR